MTLKTQNKSIIIKLLEEEEDSEMLDAWYVYVIKHITEYVTESQIWKF
jgi:hypothetical protein